MDTPLSLAVLLHDWRDFYALVGTASATLIGLLFVAASIGSGLFKEEHRAPLDSFLTPTLVHFAAAMFTCMLTSAPIHTWRILGGLLAAGGFVGLLYSGRILARLVLKQRFKIDLSDRLFYALIPVLGYLLLAMAAMQLLLQSALSADLIAAALLTLLVAGIRNAWDITVWIAINSPSNGGPSPQ